MNFSQKRKLEWLTLFRFEVKKPDNFDKNQNGSALSKKGPAAKHNRTWDM